VTAVRVVVLGVLVAVSLAGCVSRSDPTGSPRSGGGTPPPGSDESNRAEFAAVRQRLARLPAVIRVDGGYSSDPSNAGGDVLLSITARPGTDVHAVAGDAVRQVWLSRLTPVASMTAAVGPADKPAATIYRHADFDDDRAALTTRYGPRPVVH
jgi:hypothetical protein